MSGDERKPMKYAELVRKQDAELAEAKYACDLKDATLAEQSAELATLRAKLAERERQLKQANGLLARSQRAFKLVNDAFMFGANPSDETVEGEQQIEAIVELHDCSTDIAHYWYSNVMGESREL